MVRRLFTLIAGVALVACGGTDDGRPSGEPADEGVIVMPCGAADAYTTEVFLDFEGELLTFFPYPDPRAAAMCDPSVCLANEEFYFNYDQARSNEDPADPCDRATGMTVNGTPQGCGCVQPAKPGVLPMTDPAIGNRLFGREIDQGGRCDVPGNAMRLQATNIANCYGSNGRLGWGGGVDVKFARSSPDASDGEPGANGYDARDWDGISFWVKKGSSSTKSTFSVSIADPGTSPDVCSDAEDDPDTKKCDAFGVAVTVTDDWTFVPVLFRAARQKGFGKPSPLGHLDPGNLVKLQLLIGPGDWDLWIDDLAFFREPEASR